MILLHYWNTRLMHFCINVLVTVLPYNNMLLYYCIALLLHYYITAIMHYHNTALTYCCNIALLQYSIKALLHYSITTSLHYSITTFLYYCIAVLLKYCNTVKFSFATSRTSNQRGPVLRSARYLCLTFAEHHTKCMNTFLHLFHWHSNALIMIFLVRSIRTMWVWGVLLKVATSNSLNGSCALVTLLQCGPRVNRFTKTLFSTFTVNYILVPLYFFTKTATTHCTDSNCHNTLYRLKLPQHTV